MSALLTSREIVLARVPGHAIPPITDPLGKYWDQPNRFDILIDDMHAVMSRETYNALRNYAHSQPTGVYPGKMWKWHCPGADWCRCGPGRPAYLHWFGAEFERDGEKFVSNNVREILIA